MDKGKGLTGSQGGSRLPTLPSTTFHFELPQLHQCILATQGGRVPRTQWHHNMINILCITENAAGLTQISCKVKKRGKKNPAILQSWRERSFLNNEKSKLEYGL